VINKKSGITHSEGQRNDRVRIFEERPREGKPASFLPPRMFTLLDYENMMHFVQFIAAQKTELPKED